MVPDALHQSVNIYGNLVEAIIIAMSVAVVVVVVDEDGTIYILLNSLSQLIRPVKEIPAHTYPYSNTKDGSRSD